MTMETIKKNGHYLGFCNQKGYVYSVFRGYDKKGNERYMIVSVSNGCIHLLIDYTAPSHK